MRLEPAFDLARLQACIHHAYGIRICGLTYIPQGEASFSYVAEAEGGERYILKVLDDSRLGRQAAAQMIHAIPAMVELRATGVLTNLPQPVLTRTRAPLAPCEADQLALSLYVEGRCPTPGLMRRPDVWQAVARSVARLHAAPVTLRASGLEREAYDVPFEAALRDGLVALTRDDASSPGCLALAAMLLPRREALLSLLGRLRVAGDVARELASPLVLCHTDIHEANLLVDGDGDVTILDWVGLKWAPAEHDLFSFTGDEFGTFLAAYLEAGGVRSLHAETFEFYLLRRNLEDLTDYIVRILHEDDEEQAAMDIAAAEEECIAGWPYIEPGVERVREQLRNVIST